MYSSINDFYNNYPTTETETVDQSFLMPVQDVKPIAGGVAVLGIIESGSIRPGDAIEIVGIRATISATCIGKDTVPDSNSKFKRNIDRVSLNVDPSQVVQGQVLAKPGTLKAYNKFEADVYALQDFEGWNPGGVSKMEKLKFQLFNSDVGGAPSFSNDTGTIMPGDATKLSITLDSPVAMKPSLRFAIREGGRTVGAGVVAKVLE